MLVIYYDKCGGLTPVEIQDARKVIEYLGSINEPGVGYLLEPPW